MAPERNYVNLVPSFLQGGWELVKLGRWAGVFVLASALFLGAWEIFRLLSDDPPSHQYRSIQNSIFLDEPAD